MNSVKTFFIVYVLAYLFVSAGINVLLGPPGMSKAYMEQYKAEHDRYIEIGKDPVYRRWSQRPELVEMDDRLAEAATFVETYEALPEFQDEQKRRGGYDIIFDVLNTFMVVVLMVRFGRKPLMGLLDNLREQVRKRLDHMETISREAGDHRKSAQEKMHALPQDQAEIEQQTEARIEEMRRDTALRDGLRLSALNKETEDRKRNEEERAIRALKEALADAAIANVVQEFQQADNNVLQSTLVDRFIGDLADRKAASS